MVNEKFWCLNEMNKLSLRIKLLQKCYAALMSVIVVMLVPFSAHANSVDTLAQFLKNTHSGRADFHQVVTSPSKAGQPVRSKQSAGSFAFMRPTKFRFEYQKPFPQLIVADGQTLWLYDTDLAQVTARKQSQALNSTPAALIATATDLAALQKDFTLQAQPDADGLQWVQATPNNKESTMSQVRLGLSVSGQQVSLAKLDILDAMGQRSVLTFERFEVNPSGLTAASFNFVPPKGVDVVRP
jgi:outer membrane lipoprotein carrier protein